MLHQYLPVLVFAALGVLVGGAFAVLNIVLGPKQVKGDESSAAIRQMDPYECGLPSEISKTFRFGVSFYLVAMLFILFDIEVVFLYPVAAILKTTDSVFVLAEVILFVGLLFVALIYVWRKGALDWR
ncbi:MAG: NADH-quinone oxidoreductase subunit A [Solirubrobacterales bacterium]|nr:NADH-quinone oxidoreductase subunit A [Solirubrobacterales bacterium]